MSLSCSWLPPSELGARPAWGRSLGTEADQPPPRCCNGWLLGAGPSGLGEPWPWPGPAPTWPDSEAKRSDVEEFLKESEKAQKIRQRSPRRPSCLSIPPRKFFGRDGSRHLEERVWASGGPVGEWLLLTASRTVFKLSQALGSLGTLHSVVRSAAASLPVWSNSMHPITATTADLHCW